VLGMTQVEAQHAKQLSNEWPEHGVDGINDPQGVFELFHTLVSQP
jgi:hypothetical protein